MILIRPSSYINLKIFSHNTAVPTFPNFAKMEFSKHKATISVEMINFFRRRQTPTFYFLWRHFIPFSTL